MIDVTDTSGSSSPARAEEAAGSPDGPVARSVPFARPLIGEAERQAVLRVLSGPILTHGPECKAFEQEFASWLGDEARCVTMSSCMAALHMAYLHLGIGPGDEVVVPAETHVATVHAVELVGARPVFVDCDPATGNLTPGRIDAAITSKTRAISVVHFVGIPCDMPRICELARSRGLKVVEDCALALGTRWDGKHVGLFGDIGCFSFYPAKHITTGEGGMIVTRHPEVATRIARQRAFGVDRSHTERSVPGMYEVPELGLNYRMSEMQAAMGRAQIGRLDEILRRRRENFEAVERGVERLGIDGLHVLKPADPAARSSWYCLSLVLPRQLASRRTEIISRLGAAGIGTSVYYPQPVPRMAYYRNKYGYDPERYPAAETLSDRSIALPVGPHLEPVDVEHLVANLASSLGGRP